MSLSQYTFLNPLLAFIRPTTSSISHSTSSISNPTAITRSIGLLKTGFADTQHFFTHLTLKQTVILIVGTSSALYVLSPTFIDCLLYFTGSSDDDTDSTNSKKKNKNRSKMMLVRRKKKAGKHTVGLVNPANDCFANSNLQALASLRILYGYISTLALAVPPDATDLKRAEESSESSASSTTSAAPTPNGNTRSSIRSNPKGIENSPIGLTLALGKTVVALNEPVLMPKSLSPWPFLRVIEAFYNSHISRNQHDAHELLHLILESLEMEHERVSKFYTTQGQRGDSESAVTSPVPEFPFKGTTIDKITCSKCGYSPTTSSSTFIVFSLMVPQKKSAHLTDLLNEVSSPEYIKDYGCVRCRVNHVLETATATGQGRELAAALAPYADQRRLAELPDELEAQLPRSITSPISKSMQFGRLPAILAIHLSRSIYGGYGASRNSCKVTVVETIELWENIDELESAGRASSDEKKKTSIEMAAQLLGNRRKVTYRLVAMIRHKGTHHAGHYECFRRKNLEWWIDHLPKSKPESPASSASTANNSASNSPRNSESGTSNGSADRTKASENAVSKVVPESVPASPGLADVNQSFQSKKMTANSASTASSAPAVVVTLDNGTLPVPKNLKDEGAKPVALAGRVSLSKEEDDDDENHSKLPFPQANRTTPLATSKIDVTTPKQQLAYSSSSSSVVSLVAQAQQAQQHQQQQQQQQPKQQQLHQHQHKQHNSQSQYQTPQGTAVSRHFGIDVAPPSQYEWWKISDEKTWECSTRDVLKEESGAYLLFYERV